MKGAKKSNLAGAMNWRPDKNWILVTQTPETQWLLKNGYTQESTEKKRTFIRGNHPVGHTEGETIKSPWL